MPKTYKEYLGEFCEMDREGWSRRKHEILYSQSEVDDLRKELTKRLKDEVSELW